MNYKILTLTLIFFSGIVNAAFPINNVRVTITKLEVWPSNEGVGRYNALVSEPISGTGCANENGFSIEVGQVKMQHTQLC